MVYSVLQKGNRGEQVKLLQRLLFLQQDGIFGEITREAVMDYQAANGLSVDGIVGPKTWEKLLGKQTAEDADAKIPVNLNTRRTIKEIIIHCTATPEGKDYTVAQIRQWHTKPVSQGGRGWSDIGYHIVVYRNGAIHSGRDINTIGAHCTGHNAHSIGIVYVGGLDASGNPKDTRTEQQKQSLVAIVRRLHKLYPAAKIYGHCQLSSKACPCFDVEELRRAIRL